MNMYMNEIHSLSENGVHDKKSHGRNFLCWVFLCDIIARMLIWNVHKPWNVFFVTKIQFLFCNLKTQAKKGLIMYNTTNGITTLKKHVNVGPSIVKYAKKVVLKKINLKNSLFSTLTLKWY